jgi:hypothetical protein
VKTYLRGGPYGSTARVIDGNGTPERWLLPKPVEITLDSLNADGFTGSVRACVYRKTSAVRLYPDYTWLWVYEYAGEC